MVKQREYKLTKAGLFHLGWALTLIFYLFIYSSELSINNSFSRLRDLTFLLVEVIWLGAILLDKYRPGVFALMAGCAGVCLLVAMMSSNTQIPLLAVTFIIAAKGMDMEKFVAFDFKLRLLIFLALMVLSLAGVINNYSALINGSFKYAFGWKHPNTCASTLTLLALELMYLKWEKFRLRHWVLVLVVLVFMDQFCAARTSIISFLAVCLWFVLVRKTKSSDGLFARVFRFAQVNLYSLMALVSFALVLVYRKGSALGDKLNSVLTNRLYYGDLYLSEYGVSLFGQEIYTMGSRGAQASGASYSGLDMAFINMAVQWGAVYSVLFIALYTVLIYHLLKNKRYKEMLFVLFFAIVGFSSTAMLTFYRNFSLVFIWSAVEQTRQKRLAQQEEKQKTAINSAGVRALQPQ